MVVQTCGHSYSRDWGESLSPERSKLQWTVIIPLTALQPKQSETLYQKNLRFSDSKNNNMFECWWKWSSKEEKFDAVREKGKDC